jgi:hypothetical protein
MMRLPDAKRGSLPFPKAMKDWSRLICAALILANWP